MTRREFNLRNGVLLLVFSVGLLALLNSAILDKFSGADAVLLCLFGSVIPGYGIFAGVQVIRQADTF